MYGIEIIFQELGLIDPKQQTCVMELLKLYGCFAPYRLMQDMESAGFEEDIINQAVKISLKAEKEFAPSDAHSDLINKTRIWFKNSLHKIMADTIWQQTHTSALDKIAQEFWLEMQSPKFKDYHSVIFIFNTLEELQQQFAYASRLDSEIQFNKIIFVREHTQNTIQNLRASWFKLVSTFNMSRAVLADNDWHTYLQELVNSFNNQAKFLQTSGLAFYNLVSHSQTTLPLLIITNNISFPIIKTRLKEMSSPFIFDVIAEPYNSFTMTQLFARLRTSINNLKIKEVGVNQLSITSPNLAMNLFSNSANSNNPAQTFVGYRMNN